jgi:hypothetical protein
MTPSRVFEPVIDQHDTWLAVNPVQGCPKGCTYCHLQDLGQTRVEPLEVATPAETLTQLQTSPYYHPDLVLALYTCTDALATSANRAHLIALLDLLSASAVRNPVCVITKCHIPDDVIACISRNRAAGLPIIVYLSYSGLAPDIERGIDHDALRATFPALHAADIPVIHYWRPAMHQNSTPEAIEHVMDWAARYATCTVAVGLKVKPSARDQITALWPRLRDPALDPQGADSIWPRATWDFLHHIPARYFGHPIFHTNSCALAYVLQHPDRAGVLDSPTCLNANRCPTTQRERCRESVTRRDAVTRADIDAHLARIGHPGASYLWDHATRTVVLLEPLLLRDRHNLAQVLAVTVRSAASPAERHWQGRLTGAQPLVIDPA